MKKSGLCLCLAVSILAGWRPCEAASQSNTKLLLYTAAADSLGRIASPAGYSFLAEALGNKEFFVRAYAARALGVMGDKRAVVPLQKLLTDHNYLVKAYAAAALLKLGDESAKPTFLALLNDADQAARVAAVSQLGELGKRYDSTIRKLVAEDQNPFVRSKAMEQLQKPTEPPPPGHGTGIDPLLQALLNALSDPNWKIRQSACASLGKLEIKRSIPLLIERLGDENHFVRASAKEALALLGETSLIQFFRQDLNDPEPILRGSSYIALATLNDVEIVPTLIENLLAPKTPTLLRIQAARALAILKPHVERLVNNGLVMANLKNTLSTDMNIVVNYKANDATLLMIFVDALRNPANPLHEDAPFILREFRDPVVFPALREILASANPDVTRSSIYVLGELRDTEACDAIIRACKRF